MNLKTRWELLDYDYIDKLNDKEKEWLNRFTEEYTNAKLDHKGPKLHKTKRLRKDCYSRNNQRNRCILTRGKACGKVINIDEANEYKNNNILDNLIDQIDKKKFSK